MMLWTEHAEQRARERFPDIDLAAEYASARRVGKNTKKRIKLACPQAARIYMNGFVGRYCCITPNYIVFVMQAPETVVTVFRLER